MKNNETQKKTKKTMIINEKQQKTIGNNKNTMGKH